LGYKTIHLGINFFLVTFEKKTKMKFLKSVLIIVSSFLLISWGQDGHYKISYNSSLSFNTEMQQFVAWKNQLAMNASNADDRKATDPDESAKHYIDIDNYAEFLSTGKIPQTLDSAVSLHGEIFVYDNGILPWATLAAYDSLKVALHEMIGQKQLTLLPI
jgi:hypothetical protein